MAILYSYSHEGNKLEKLTFCLFFIFSKNVGVRLLCLKYAHILHDPSHWGWRNNTCTVYFPIQSSKILKVLFCISQMFLVPISHMLLVASHLPYYFWLLSPKCFWYLSPRCSWYHIISQMFLAPISHMLLVPSSSKCFWHLFPTCS